jgi:hypothetical protein
MLLPIRGFMFDREYNIDMFITSDRRSLPPAMHLSVSAIENLTCAKTLIFEGVWSAKSKGTGLVCLQRDRPLNPSPARPCSAFCRPPIALPGAPPLRGVFYAC